MTLAMPTSTADSTAASTARVPCTIVTGFLGAGKTTLIRHVLANAQGRRLAVIVNEFGDVGIDGEILKGCGDAACPEENIVELANGCLCCTVADEFVPALDAILALRPAVEHIVIETSGLALPKPLVQAFQWPSIKSRVTVDGVIAVVDGAALADGRVAADLDALARQRAADMALDHDDPIEEVFEDQIACADLVVLNKRDLHRRRRRSTRRSPRSRARCRAPSRSSRWRTARSIPAALLGPRRRHRGRHREPPHPPRRRGRRTTTTISTASWWRCPRSPIRPRSRRASRRSPSATTCCASRVSRRCPASRCGCWCRRSGRASRINTTGRGLRARRAPARSWSSACKGIDRAAITRALVD